jgi:hypothetical protein
VSFRQYDNKRDANEREIVAALSETGHEVELINGSPFDLLVGRNHWVVMEVKSAHGRLTDSQARFFGNGRLSPRVIVRSVDDALEAARRYC